MTVETQGLDELSVLWIQDGTADEKGNDRLGPAVEISCRWELTKRLSQGANTNERRGAANVDVDREIPLGSLLWRGEKKDLPAIPTDLFKVIGYNEIGDVKNRDSRRLIVVDRYKGKFPGAV